MTLLRWKTNGPLMQFNASTRVAWSGVSPPLPPPPPPPVGLYYFLADNGDRFVDVASNPFTGV